MWLLLLLLPLNSFAIDDKYDKAVSVTIPAILKQSGVEADFLRVQHVAGSKVSKWFKDNGLSTVATVGSVVLPILYYKAFRATSGDFTIEGKRDKVQLIFQVQF